MLKYQPSKLLIPQLVLLLPAAAGGVSNPACSYARCGVFAAMFPYETAPTGVWVKGAVNVMPGAVNAI